MSTRNTASRARSFAVWTPLSPTRAASLTWFILVSALSGERSGLTRRDFVASAESKVEKVAKFVAGHFRENVHPLGYKAFVVAVEVWWVIPKQGTVAHSRAAVERIERVRIRQ